MYYHSIIIWCDHFFPPPELQHQLHLTTQAVQPLSRAPAMSKHTTLFSLQGTNKWMNYYSRMAYLVLIFSDPPLPVMAVEAH